MCHAHGIEARGAARSGKAARRENLRRARRKEGEAAVEKTKVSAGIVVYNGAGEAAAAAKSLLENTKDAALHVYLIDNASPDGAGEALAGMDFGEDAEVLRLPENRGFGGGHNAVLEKLDSRYHFVVNPDITLTEDSVSALCRWMDAHPDVVMATPRLRFPSGEEQYTAKRRPTFLALLARQTHLPFLKNVERHYLMLDEDLSRPQEIDFCTGCFFVMRTEAFRAIGGFDESYFMYVEDADITRKAQALGKVMYAPVTAVTHAWHRDANRKWKNFWMQVSSMLHYWRKWGFRFV